MHLHASIVTYYIIYVLANYYVDVGNIRKHFGNSFAINQGRGLSPYPFFFVKMNVMFVA